MIATQVFKIQSKTLTDDTIGGSTVAWGDTLSVNGVLDLITGSDNTALQNAFVEQSTHLLIIPKYTSDISDPMRVVDEYGRWYSITYVDDPVGQHHHLEVYLKFGGVVSG